MRDALRRLKALQQELEDLHRTTAKVLAESEQLIGELEAPAPGIIVPQRRVRGIPDPPAPSSRRPRKRRG